MKKLSELEISPSPWSEASYGLIVSSDNKKVADFCGSEFDPSGPDFIMMKASPELYQALYDLHYWSGRLLETGKDDFAYAMVAARIAECRERAEHALDMASGVKEQNNSERELK